MEPSYLVHLDPTADLWTYELAEDRLIVSGRRASEDRGAWRTVERHRPLHLRLSELAEVSGELAVLRDDWREHALAFANLFAPPVPTRRLALAREVSLGWFAQEALLLHWALRLKSSLGPGEARSRLDAAKAALHLRALAPDLPEESVTHVPNPTLQEAEPPLPPLSLSAEEVKQRLRRLGSGAGQRSRVGQHAYWSIATNVLASLLNLRVAGVTPVCAPGQTRGGLPQLGLGFHFPSPRAHIWFSLWKEFVGLQQAECERCHRPFLTTLTTQRFCSKACQVADGVERHRHKARPKEDIGG